MDRRDFLRLAGAAAIGVTGLSSARPNIVVVLVDDMGAFDLGCYGQRNFETPGIDRVAAQGMRFTQSYAASPVCSPTRASLLTGKWPARLGITDWIPGAPAKPGDILNDASSLLKLRGTEWTLPEVLRTMGYRTALAGKWHLGNPSRYHAGPEWHGFDESVLIERPDGDDDGYLPDGEYVSDFLGRQAVQFIEANAGNPFFLLLSHYDVHSPAKGRADLISKYEKKQRRTGRDFNPRYAAMVEGVDESVCAVLDALDRTGVAGDTVVVVTSDNGGNARLTDLEGLRGTKSFLYEGGLRVPLVVSAPGLTPPNSMCSTPVWTGDLFPTLRRLGGKVLPCSVDGQDLVPLMKGRRMVPRPLFWHFPHYNGCGGRPAAAVRWGDLKLIRWFEDERRELFDLRYDPGEQDDISGRFPAEAAQLDAALTQWLLDTVASMPTPIGD